MGWLHLENLSKFVTKLPGPCSFLFRSHRRSIAKRLLRAEYRASDEGWTRWQSRRPEIPGQREVSFGINETR
jgi:hypothetical protein